MTRETNVEKEIKAKEEELQKLANTRVIFDGDIIESNDNNGQFTSVYYNINNIYDGMAIFKALTNKSILDALDEELDDDYRDTALEGFTINIGLYKDNNYKEVREKTIAITVSVIIMVMIYLKMNFIVKMM